MPDFLDQEFPERYFNDDTKIVDEYTKKIIEKFDLQNNIKEESTTKDLFLLVSMIPELNITSRGTDIQVLACLSLIGYKDDIVIISRVGTNIGRLFIKKCVPPKLLRRLLLLIQRLGFRKTLAILKNNGTSLQKPAG